MFNTISTIVAIQAAYFTQARLTNSPINFLLLVKSTSGTTANGKAILKNTWDNVSRSSILASLRDSKLQRQSLVKLTGAGLTTVVPTKASLSE